MIHPHSRISMAEPIRLVQTGPMVDSLADDEKACLHALAALATGGITIVGLSIFDSVEGLTETRRHAILKMLEHLKAISRADKIIFITPVAIQLSRELRKPRNIVAQIKERAESIGFIAWAVIVFLTFAAIFTGLNQATQFFQSIGWVAKL